MTGPTTNPPKTPADSKAPDTVPTSPSTAPTPVATSPVQSVKRPADLPASNHYPSVDAAKLSAEYEYLVSIGYISKYQAKITAAVDILAKHLDNEYKKVQQAIGIPAWAVGLIHYRESSFRFNAYLHNGDPLGKKTIHVPEGIGPFYDWETAAIDALSRYKGFTDWSFGSTFRRLEMYNGPGYRTGRMAGTVPPNASPYAFSGTPYYEKGMSIEDHSWYPEAVDDRPGVLALFFELRKRGLIPGVQAAQSSAPSVPIQGSSELSILRGLAATVGQGPGMEKLIAYRNANRPTSRPNFWAIVDMTMHSSKKRMFVFDVAQNRVDAYWCAHGSGSEGKKDDGIAEVFSNVSGSNCTSLGIYLGAETYNGKHGLSLRLDGMESSNSNARDRAIVLHGADYVSQSYVNDFGRIGRSQGCPAVPNEVAKNLATKLSGGSLILIHA